MSSKTKPKAPKQPPRRGKRLSPRQRLVNWIGLTVVAGFVIFALVVMFTTPRKDRGPRLPQRTGQPWEYDARFDAYWDPRPGHEHWHEGLPPEPADR